MMSRLSAQELGKTFTVYRLEVTTQDGRYFSLQKRYSSFHELHMRCRERYQVSAHFPPKTLSNTTAKVMDFRRAGLESYLQALTSIYPLPGELMEFLHLQDIVISPHQTPGNTFYFYMLSVLIEHFLADFVTPVLKLLTDFNDESQEVEEDMITQSALRAFYDDEEVME